MIGRNRIADALPGRKHDSIRSLETQLNEISKKVVAIDAVSSCLDELPIQKLLTKFDTLESLIVRTENVTYECGDSSSSSATHMEERVIMRAVPNQALVGEAILLGRIKIPKLKLFYGARDAKALENFIYDIEQYFKATNTIIEEAKVTLATMHRF